MIDTHAHIDTDAFAADLPEVVDRARAAGVEAMIIPAIEPNTFERVRRVAEQYPMVYAAYGVHPHDTKDFGDGMLGAVRKYAASAKCCAIGEIGLDYYYDYSPKEKQIEAFSAQLRLAQELDLPVIIHNRDADADIIATLEAAARGRSISGVLHCFSSDVEMMRRAIDMGLHVSFTGNITFKKSTLSDVVLQAPLERIMLETDCPWMAPAPNRGKRNEPSMVRAVAEKIAEIKSINIEEVISMTTNNAKRLFKLFLLLIAICSSTLTLAAQEEAGNETPAESTAHKPRFHKVLGIGPIFGSLTTVDTQFLPEGEKDISNEGIFVYGGRVSYGLENFLLLDFSVIHGKDTKPTQKDATHGPNYHTFFDLSAHWIPNHESRVNYYATTGLSYIMNHYDDGGPVGYDHKFNVLGVNVGLGFNINIDCFKFGLVNLTAEWKVTFPFKRTTATILDPDDPNKKLTKQVEMSTFYSIPQFGIIFYPNF